MLPGNIGEDLQCWPPSKKCIHLRRCWPGPCLAQNRSLLTEQRDLKACQCGPLLSCVFMCDSGEIKQTHCTWVLHNKTIKSPLPSPSQCMAHRASDTTGVEWCECRKNLSIPPFMPESMSCGKSQPCSFFSDTSTLSLEKQSWVML